MGWDFTIVAYVCHVQDPSGWTIELRKESEKCSGSLCLNKLSFFTEGGGEKSGFLHMITEKDFKGWGHPGEGEATAWRVFPSYLPPLSEMHLYVDKQRSVQAQGRLWRMLYIKGDQFIWILISKNKCFCNKKQNQTS